MLYVMACCVQARVQAMRDARLAQQTRRNEEVDVEAEVRSKVRSYVFSHVQRIKTQTADSNLVHPRRCACGRQIKACGTVRSPQARITSTLEF